MNQRCAHCGKLFRIAEHTGWGYAYAGKYTCSYSCMRAMEKEDLMKQIDPETKQKALRMAAEGATVQEIVRETGISENSVYRIKAQGKKKEEGTMAEPEKAETKPAEPRMTENEPSLRERELALRLLLDVTDIIKKLYRI